MIDDNVVRLGQYVVARRQELGMISRRALATHARMCYRVLGDIERGSRRATAGTYAILEQGLGWPAGAIARILTGGEPPGPEDTGDEIVGHVVGLLSYSDAVGAERLVLRGDIPMKAIGQARSELAQVPDSGGEWEIFQLRRVR